MQDNLSIQKVRIGEKISSDDIKIICGKGYDVHQPLPIKYREVRERFLNSRKNFWMPDEIAMGEDKLQWETDVLTEDEMWLFKTNISYLTAGDNMVPDNLVNAIFQHITANEMRQYLRLVVAEEANHVESYVFILESFGLDEKGQGQIYDLYKDLPEITEKVNWNLNFTRQSALSNEPLESPRSIELLIEDLLSYYIFEYVFFPLGFTQIFALARLGKLKNTAQQYKYLFRDECYCKETELLTNNGWMSFKDLTHDTLVAQFNKDETIEFIKPSRIVEYDRDDYMIHFTNKKGTIDIKVTPDHRMMHKNHYKGKLPGEIQESLAKDIKLYPRREFIVAGKKINGRSKLTPYERFLIAFQADGSLPDKRHTGELVGYLKVTIGIKKQRKVDRLRKILNDTNLIYNEPPPDSRGMVYFKINAKLDITKEFNWVDLDSVNYEWCQEFIKETSNWDGSKKYENDPDYDDDSSLLYDTTNKSCADAVHSISIMAGYRCKMTRKIDNRKESYKDIYRLFILTNTNVIDSQTVNKDYVPYNDKVYCVTVNSGMIITRRNGCVMISGNSNHAENGMFLIKQIIKENPGVWSNRLKNRCYEMVDEAINLEHKQAKAVLPNGGIKGMSIDNYMKFGKFLCDNTLRELGLNEMYKIKHHPMPWISEYELKQEVNFFEGRVSDYQIGTNLEWG